MPTGRILDLNAKSQDLKENEMPAALIYFEERVPVYDWQELFFIAVKCLYAEFPDTINSLCSTDPKRNLFLRTNTIDMISPKKIAPIIYLETQRTPQQIIKAIKLIFSRANVRNIHMRIEVYEPLYPPKKFPLPIPNSKINSKPVLHLNQTIEEMLATLDAMENYAPKKSKVVLPHASSYGRVEPQVFGNLFFELEGTRHGPFANEKNRYVALMQCLAELYPYQILKEAGHHINSEHRLTLMKGSSYLYFREPVELPNNLFIDKDFPDRVLVENERYYLARCGLYFESVMFNG
ncbi:MAG: hypothetical protein IJK81_13090 [Selenomonadaceae bacterium]|nr:hypothetical protein [Selenomonadaceae bacterium]